MTLSRPESTSAPIDSKKTGLSQLFLGWLLYSSPNDKLTACQVPCVGIHVPGLLALPAISIIAAISVDCEVLGRNVTLKFLYNG